MPEKMDMAQDMPMCERKNILNKLQNMVNEIEPNKQNPQVLIKSEVCNCSKSKESQCYHKLQQLRAANQTPPQSFEIERLVKRQEEEEKLKRISKKQEKEEGPPTDSQKKQDDPKGKEPEKTDGKKPNQEEETVNERKNVITVQRMCQHYPEDESPEIKALLKEGKLPAENEEVCTKDAKTGTFTCYKVRAGGRVIEQFTDAQPLPEERRVVPHPSIPIPHPSTNYELRGSKLFIGCNCLKRNGMQHDCPRTECQGKRECLKFPAPVCQPSGLAPPIIKISPITTAIEPECGPRKRMKVTKTEMEKRKVLLNYARAQYYQWPPSPRVPCQYHKKGLYYIRPLQRIADVQTGNELLDEYINSENFKKSKEPEKKSEERTSKSGKSAPIKEKAQEKEKDLKTDDKKDVKDDKNQQDEKKETKKPNRTEETLMMLEKDLKISGDI